MNFDLTEEETMLKALAERFVSDRYDAESRRRMTVEPTGFTRANWELLGELGLIGAVFDEGDGGLGLDATGIATLFEALGHGLVTEPLLENVLIAGRLFARCASDALKAQWLPSLMSGRRRLALAYAEGRQSGEPWITMQARLNGRGMVLNGRKSFVPAGAEADAFVVAARESGASSDRDGIALFLVPAATPGLTITPWRLTDASVAVSLDFDDVAIDPDWRLTGGCRELAEAETLGSLARAAEAVGIMARLFGETLDYLRTREQFGVTLGSFQALQHRMAMQYATLEQCRALLNRAIVSHGGPGFAQAVVGARAFIAPASIALGHEMIQMHGGMGVSDELIIGHGHKRLLVLSRWPDDPDRALDAYAGLS